MHFRPKGQSKTTASSYEAEQLAHAGEQWDNEQRQDRLLFSATPLGSFSHRGGIFYFLRPLWGQNAAPVILLMG